MPDVTTFIARTFGGSVKTAIKASVQASGGWHRIGIVLSVLIVAGAGAVLFHILRDIDMARVWEAMSGTSPRLIAMAALFVGVAYITLTFYDYFSLQTIGCGHVPYRIAAMASFTSYSIGHNLGATVFTAGAVRWRIYSAWKLSVVDVARMAFVTGLTFWLGNIVVLGVCFIIEPSAAAAVDHLPPLVNQVIGAVGLAAIGGYWLWLMPQPRRIGRGGWSVTLPNAPLTLIQIGIGLLDLGAGGLAFYTLLPASPDVGFITVWVIYVTATLIGFLSHAPGSLGVFEAAMLIALPQFAKEDLLASLLIFRCLYFVLPLVLAVALMAVREAWMAVHQG